MKLKTIFILFIYVSFVALVSAQKKQNSNDLKMVVNKLIEFCKTNNIQSASKIIAYDGPDEKRRFTEFSRLNIPAERKRINKICKRIKALAKMADSFNIEIQTRVNQRKNSFFVAKVVFHNKNQNLKFDFRFVKIESNFALVDIK